MEGIVAQLAKARENVQPCRYIFLGPAICCGLKCARKYVSFTEVWLSEILLFLVIGTLTADRQWKTSRWTKQKQYIPLLFREEGKNKEDKRLCWISKWAGSGFAYQ